MVFPPRLQSRGRGALAGPAGVYGAEAQRNAAGAMTALHPFWVPTEQLQCDARTGWVQPAESWRHCNQYADKITDELWGAFRQQLKVCSLDGAEYAPGSHDPVPPGGWWLLPRPRGDDRRERLVLQEVPQLEVARLLHKLQQLRGYKERSSLEAAPARTRLDFADFKALFLVQEVTQEITSFMREAQAGVAALYYPLARAAWQEALQLELPELFAEQYRPGDVIFYDLLSRERVGEVDLRGRLNSWLFKVQRYYDRFSHSGLFVRAMKQPRGGPYTTGDRPAVFHSIGSRVKILRFCASFACIPKREIDFSCVFGEGPHCWQGLLTQEREEAVRYFEEAVQRHLSRVGEIRNKTAGTKDYFRIVGGSAAECKDMDKDPCATWKLCREGEAAEPRRVMCSGFTAALLLEAWRECAGRFLRLAGDAREAKQFQKHLRLSACGSVRPALNRNCLDFSPRDLHKWPVWRRDLERPPGLLRVASGAVRDAFAQLLRWPAESDPSVPTAPCSADCAEGDLGLPLPLEYVSDRLVAVSSGGAGRRAERRGRPAPGSARLCVGEFTDDHSDIGPASPSATSVVSCSTQRSAATPGLMHWSRQSFPRWGSKAASPQQTARPSDVLSPLATPPGSSEGTEPGPAADRLAAVMSPGSMHSGARRAARRPRLRHSSDSAPPPMRLPGELDSYVDPAGSPRQREDTAAASGRQRRALTPTRHKPPLDSPRPPSLPLQCAQASPFGAAAGTGSSPSPSRSAPNGPANQGAISPTHQEAEQRPPLRPPAAAPEDTCMVPGGAAAGSESSDDNRSSGVL